MTTPDPLAPIRQLQEMHDEDFYARNVQAGRRSMAGWMGASRRVSAPAAPQRGGGADVSPRPPTTYARSRRRRKNRYGVGAPTGLFPQ